MKLKAFFIAIIILHTGVILFAQTVTLKVKNAPLIEVIDKINNQTGFDFLFTTSAMKIARPVSMDVRNAAIADVLAEIFQYQPLGFTIRDKSVLIFKKELPANDKMYQAPAGATGTATLRGFVSDSTGQPMAGATISMERTKHAAITQADGSFKLSGVSPGSYILHASYAGFADLVMAVQVNGHDSTIRLTMQAVSSLLDEVKVIAYGYNTQRLMVGAVSIVRAKDIAMQPVNNFLQALEGRIPGLIVTPTSGAPGSMAVAQIRGQNTMANAVGFKSLPLNINQPFYLVDGVPLASQNNVIQDPGLNNSLGANLYASATGLSPLNTINPADIDNISVLKDADATSIYGSQGSNGVVLITTKKGTPGEDRLHASFRSGPTFASRNIRMMNTAQYLEMRRDALSNSGMQASLGTNDADLLLFDPDRNRNYTKDFFGGMGRHTDANAGISGGSEAFTYLVNLGTTHESYNFPGGFADSRLSMHSVFNRKSSDKKLIVELGADYSYNKNNSSGTSLQLSAFTLPPNMPDLVDAKGGLVWTYKGYDLGNTPLGNPAAYLRQRAYTGLSNMIMHLYARYQVWPSLKMIVSAGYNRLTDDNYAAFPRSTQNPGLSILGFANFGGSQAESINIEPQLNFNKKAGRRGRLDILLGGSYRKHTAKNESVFVYGYVNDALLTSIAGGNSTTFSNNTDLYKYVAAFARLNFIWGNKYIVNMTANRNGSSNFGPDRRFGTFGSAGIGWILSEESFFKGVSVLSFAKISGNYGTSGSDGVAPYQYQPNWAPVISLNGYQGYTGYYPVNPENSSYAWSLNKKLNMSIELGLLKNRIQLNITAYENKVSDQLVTSNQPIQTGFSDIITNTPYVVKNAGLEISIDSKNISSRSLRWTSTFIISHNSNQLERFPDWKTSRYRFTYIPGQSVNAIPVVPFEGVDPMTGVFTFRKADGTLTFGPNTSSGFNNTGGDATRLVDLSPRLTGGFNNTLAYKTISLTVFFQFVKQTGPDYLYSVYGNPVLGLPGNPNINQPADLTGRWRKPGDRSVFQRVSEGPYTAIDRTAEVAAHSFTASTGAYSDASFIRLKTVSLAFCLPAYLINKLHINKCTLFVQGQNLFLITGYKRGDPETQYLFTIPPQRTIAAGIEIII